MTTATLESIRLQEDAVYSDHPNVDRANGVIRNVKVLGRHSKNGREYSDAALNDAARLYEGAEVFFDHDRKEPNRERRVLESIGTLRHSTRKGDAVFADLHYLTTHADTPTLLERINRKMRIGLSHNADGDGSRKGGKFIVESIARVSSVDLVLNPATNGNLFESMDGSQLHYSREALAAVLTGRGSFLESDEAAKFVASQSREVDSAKEATLAELPPANSVAEFLKMHATELEAAFQSAIGLVSKHPDLSAATIKSVVGKLVEQKRNHLAAVESILQPANAYAPPALPGDEEPVPGSAAAKERQRQIESVIAEVDRRAGRTPIFESDNRPVGTYEQELKSFRPSLSEDFVSNLRRS